MVAVFVDAEEISVDAARVAGAVIGVRDHGWHKSIVGTYPDE